MGVRPHRAKHLVPGDISSKTTGVADPVGEGLERGGEADLKVDINPLSAQEGGIAYF
jgi:hypothetical protein